MSTFDPDPQLVAKAARNLAGRPCIVRWQKPANIDAAGTTWIDQATKRGIIDVMPGLSEEKALYVLAHELAHIRLGHAPELAPDVAKRAPASIRYRPEVARWLAIRPEESDADTQALAWLDYAKANEHKYRQATRLERSLASLAAWQPEEITRMITAAAKAAVLACGFTPRGE